MKVLEFGKEEGPEANAEFNPIQASTDPTYLEAHKDEALAFAEEYIRDIDNPDFLYALKIMGDLEQTLDPELLMKAMHRDETTQTRVILYLARVPVVEMSSHIITLINPELEAGEGNENKLYRLISALMMTGGTEAKIFLRWLSSHKKLQTDPFLKLIGEHARLVSGDNTNTLKP